MFSEYLQGGLAVIIHFMDVATPVTENLYDEELALYKENLKEINALKLKIFQLYTAKLCDLSIKREINKKIEQAEGEIVKILARTTMQNCMQKIDNCNNSSPAVDVFLQLSLELVEKQIKHCREVQLKVLEEESGTLEGEIGNFEKMKVEILLVINDANHPKRKDYLFEIVHNITLNVADLLVNHPIDDDNLKVALCLFELLYDQVDECDYEIVMLKICRRRHSRESIAYANYQNEISELKKRKKQLRESLAFRACLRTNQRLTDGNCVQLVEVRLWMVLLLKEMFINLVKTEIQELSLITDLSINTEELVTTYEDFNSATYDEITLIEAMQDGNDNERRADFKDKIFEEVTKLNDEEIELLDKVLYNEEIHDKECPVCLDEHTCNELLVSLRCYCKRERLCQSCALKAMKEKSQCPCCRAYV